MGAGNERMNFSDINDLMDGTGGRSIAPRMETRWPKSSSNDTAILKAILKTITENE
jgi:hypothetical protein